MELSQNSFLEHLIMAPTMADNSCNHFTNELFPTSWNFNSQTDPIQDFLLPDPSLLQQIQTPTNEYNNNNTFPSSFFDSNEQPSLDVFTSPELSSIYDPNQEMYTSIVDNFVVSGFENGVADYKIETGLHVEINNAPFYGDNETKVKPCSKNLMAERRRRKRLNDRLSLLRSIVPKISKMDRTSIVGDTIDYMRELLIKIDKLREEGVDENANDINLMGHYLKELKPNEIIGKNTPKFDVRRREQDTRVDICCAAKPGLLLSTLGTLEAMGLDVRQCVISCFNDFSMQASCHEVADHQSCISSEDAKQALFRNAGYGGRCQ